MDYLLIREVRLEGFGLFAQAVRFVFSDGLNVLTAPNESGKSTLLAGLQSVLFGLPEKSDAEQWGTARFRNWSGSPRFRGEVTLLSAGTWHRLQRNFATHEVHWATAPSGPRALPGAHAGEHDRRDPAAVPRAAGAHGPAAAPPAAGRGRVALAVPRGAASLLLEPPPEEAWTSYFTGLHNPGGRGEPVLRYQALLGRLLGLDDAGLFRLTYCLAQDPEERTSEEAAFRSRQVPEIVQGLISGAGGQVDRVLACLFDRYAAITQATAEADLVRPGKTRAANQRTPGRLEEVRERMRNVSEDLKAARQTLEDLQGSQERLDEIRLGLQRQRESLEHDRGLKGALEEWARARQERNRAHKRAAELERAVRDLEELDRSIGEQEGRLGQEYPEYRGPGFAFDAKHRELEELIAAERERATRRTALEEARRRKESLEKSVAAGDEKIAERFSAFRERPHLLRDFDGWQEAALELEHLRAELLELDDQISEQEAVLARYRPWIGLDAAASGGPETARPTAHLRALHDLVPRLLGRIDELERCGRERDRLEQRRRDALTAPAGAGERALAEAEAFTDRRALYRGEADTANRRLRDIDEQRAEADRAEQALQSLRETLATRTGSRDEQRWAALAELLRRKSDGLHEEADLLRKIDAADRVLRAGLTRTVLLPGAITLVAAALATYALATLAGAASPVPLIAALGAGLLGGGVAGLLGSRRGKSATRLGLSLARERLATLRRSLQEADADLGSLADLDGHALQELLAQIQSHGQRAAEAERLRALALSEEEREAAAATVRQAEQELQDFEARMAPFGADPAGLVSEWRRTESRLAELAPKLEELALQVGPRDWAHVPLADLPGAWREPGGLADLVRGRLPADADGWPDARPDAVAPLETGEQVVEVLRKISTDHWQSWMAEATACEAAAQRLASLALRRQAVLGAEGGDGERLRQLEQRVAQLAAACAPLTLEVPREEIEILAGEYGQVRAERDRSQTLLEELAPELPHLEEQVRATEQRAVGLRDGLRGLLRPAASDPATALRRVEAARELAAELARARDRRAQVLKTMDAAEPGDLAGKLEAAREESRVAFERSKALEERYVLLRELSQAEPERLQQQQSDLERRIREREVGLEALADQQESLRSRAADAHAEGRRVGNVAALELELEALEEEERHLLLERDAVALAFQTLRAAEGLYSRTHRERLEQRATEIVRRLSLAPERSVRLGERFEIQVTEAGGRPCAIRQLSQGARDQLALALRLAVADLLAGDLRMPLFFDDPFLTYDPERMASIREALSAVAAERQVVVLSHRPELAGWGTAVARAL